jgi:hypothetical protein
MKSARRPLVALATMLVLVVIQAVADPTGVLALVGWSGALPQASAGIWGFAPYVVFVPVLLGVLWWVAARAGDRYWTLVPGVILAVLLAQAAATFVMSWNLGVAAWAAGYVTAKAVPAALIVAAFTRWFGGPTNRVRLERGSIWIPAGLYAAVAPLVAGLWWTSAAYAPGVPAARPDRGFLSMLVAVLLIAGATGLSLRWMRARVPGVLGGWLAAVVAGAVVGVVQAIVAAIVDGGFNGDIWPLMTTYIAVADGLSFGACVGWVVGVTAVVADRLRAGRSARTFQLAAAIVAVVAIGTAVVVSAVGSSSAADAASNDVPKGFLRADGDVIRDGDGNQLLLRGVNVNQLVDFYQPRADVAATDPLTEEDFARIAELGFNVVRLNLSWSALEPERGTLDQAYVDRISQAVDWAEQHDLYVVLDMHQDAWWNGATADGTACRPGTDPMWGYDGAPEWATITDGAPRCQFQGRDISPAGNRAFENFYFDTDGIQTALVETWGKLAAEFKDEPAVAGFDLLNEPGFGETAPVTTSYLLGRYYDRAIERIRSVGAPQMVFVEPSIFWSGLGFDSGPTPGFTNDRNIVFSPHLYAESLTMDRSLGIPSIVGMDRQFTLAKRVAAEYDAPLWSGEIGYWGEHSDVIDWLDRYAAAEDANLLGSAFWVWKQACGDPQGGINDVTTALSQTICATGEDAPVDGAKVGILSRAYPQTAPGRLTSLKADGPNVELAGTTDGKSCDLKVWVPGARQPEVTGTGVHDIASTAVDGGWFITACVDGDYTLSTGD